MPNEIDPNEVIPFAHNTDTSPLNYDLDIDGDTMIVPIPEGGQHLATLAVFNVDERVVAWMIMVDDEGTFIDIPPHMAAQLPMVMQMMKAQAGQ